MAVFTRVLFAAAIAAISSGLALPAAAQDAANYPNKPVRIIVPFAPGGASDFAARVIQHKLSDILGQQLVVENRPGASGNIGMDVAARSAPDGYTLFLGNIGTVALNPYVYRDLGINPTRDFIAISIIADMPSLLVAHPKFPPNNVKELIDYVKARPGQVNFASPGTGTLDHLEMELFRQLAGLEMNHIPYKGGAGPAASDVVGGHVNVMFGTIASTLPHVRGGLLKAYAVTTADRIAAIPEIPSVAEVGFPQAIASSWQGLLAPAGTPQPIIDKLHAALVQTMKDPDIQRRYAEIGAIAKSSASPAEFLRFIQEEGKRWEAVIKKSKILPE